MADNKSSEGTRKPVESSNQKIGNTPPKKLTTLECMECGYREIFTEQQFEFTDGLSCYVCKGPTKPAITKPEEEINNRRMKKQNPDEEIVTYATYKCLCCGYQDKVSGKRKAYSEVTVCPKCNGAFIDKWKVSKYIGGADFSSGKDFTLETYFDMNGTIKGLKTIQREAKKATASLKELEKIQGKVIETCPRCGNKAFEILEWKTIDGGIVSYLKTCQECNLRIEGVTYV